MHNRGWSASRALIAGPLVLMVALGCAPSRDAGFEEDALDEPRATDDEEDIRHRWDRACDRVLEPVDGDRARVEDLDVLEALDALDEMSRVHSALSVPRVTEQLERFDGMVILAPLDTGVPADLADGEADDDGALEDQAATRGDVEAGVPPPEAFVAPDGARLLDDLLEVGQVDTADGGAVTFERVEDRVVVRRGDAQVEVVCADLQVRDAVIQVLSGEPYDVGEDGSLRPDTDTDREELAPDIDERLDELDGPDGDGGGTTGP